MTTRNASKIIIAIDGPSASGKGTIARGIAKFFNYSHLDTGLLYRAVGRKTFEIDPEFSSEMTAIRMAQNFDASWLDDPLLRNDESSALASKVAVIGGVRQALLDFQRNFALFPPSDGAVLDGRDIGTVICPKAPIKLYITASAEVRAERRYKELLNRGDDVTYEQVLSDLQARDERDKNRTNAPLKMANDAVALDTSKMSIDEAISKAVELTQEALSNEDRVFVCF